MKKCILEIQNLTKYYGKIKGVENLSLKLEEGEIFGDIALRNTQKQRTASIITINDCVFGTLTQAAYDQCFKGTQEKIRNLNCCFFVNFESVFSCLHFIITFFSYYWSYYYFFW